MSVCIQSVDPNDYNGKDFHYIVHYRQIDDNGVALTDEVTQRVEVQDVETMVFAVPNQPIFQSYEISVEAANSVGTAAEGSPDKHKGHSGQDGKCI